MRTLVDAGLLVRRGACSAWLGMAWPALLTAAATELNPPHHHHHGRHMRTPQSTYTHDWILHDTLTWYHITEGSHKNAFLHVHGALPN